MPTPGEPVEVFIPLTGSWVGGFVVLEEHGDNLSLRRDSDGAVLPASVPAPQVRPAIRRNSRW